MTTKEELEKSTFVGRNTNVWFMFSWALVMFIIDGIVFAVDAPPGESKWEYGPSVFLMCLVRLKAATWKQCEGIMWCLLGDVFFRGARVVVNGRTGTGGE
jgi:hypothetical protein